MARIDTARLDALLETTGLRRCQLEYAIGHRLSGEVPAEIKQLAWTFIQDTTVHSAIKILRSKCHDLKVTKYAIVDGVTKNKIEDRNVRARVESMGWGVWWRRGGLFTLGGTSGVLEI